jgi:hypothetical protein
MQADYIGLGKTTIILTAFIINLLLVMQKNRVHLFASPRLLLGKDRTFKSAFLQIRATFISAYSNSVKL